MLVSNCEPVRLQPIIYPYHVRFREGASSLAKHREATAKLLVTPGNGIAVSLSLSLSRLLSVMLLASYITQGQERKRNAVKQLTFSSGTVHCQSKAIFG